jgi:hypothetical protein
MKKKTGEKNFVSDQLKKILRMYIEKYYERESNKKIFSVVLVPLTRL